MIKMSNMRFIARRAHLNGKDCISDPKAHEMLDDQPTAKAVVTAADRVDCASLAFNRNKKQQAQN